jgi:5-methylcytosine-specific restriction protein A
MLLRLSIALGISDRSPEWPRVRQEHLARHPRCEVCDRKRRIEVHHIVPYWVDRTLELEPRNLISLCRTHHFWFGHLGSWASWNPDVLLDATVWFLKIQGRPGRRRDAT